jgi:putative membrane protein
MKKIYLTTIAALLAGTLAPILAHADDVAPRIGMSTGLLLSVVYGLVGILLLMIGYKIFEWITPFSVNDALSKDQNRALGIVVGAIFIGVAIIVAAALG